MKYKKKEIVNETVTYNNTSLVDSQKYQIYISELVKIYKINVIKIHKRDIKNCNILKKYIIEDICNEIKTYL